MFFYCTFVILNEKGMMIGTIVNTCTIIVGTLIGVALHKGIKVSYAQIRYSLG